MDKPSHLLIILLLVSMLATGIAPVHAQTSLEVVDPVDGDNDILASPGTTFFVDIMISDVSGLFAWQADLAYNPGILSVVSVNLGEPWLTLVLLGRASCPQNIDNTMGAVSAACTLLAPQGPLNFPGVRSNTLYSIEFMVNGNGISALDLMNDVLLTQSLSEIAHSTIDGFFATEADFIVTVGPESVSLLQGSTATVNVTVVSISGFSSTMDLTVESGLPFGVSFDFSVESGIPTFTSLLTLTAALDATVGETQVVVKAFNQTVSRTATFTLVVVSSADFRISARPGLVLVPIGGNGTSTLTLTSINGFSGQVSLVARIQPVFPNGPTVTFDSQAVPLPPDGTATSTMLVTTTNLTPQQVYGVEVTAFAGPLEHTVVIDVSVIPALPPAPTLARWQSRAPMPTPREGYGAANVGGTIYYVAGYHDGDSTINEAYDTATDTWSLRASLPSSPRSETVAVTDGTYVYLIGGRPVSLVGSELWRYDPRSDSWTSLAPIPTPRATEHMAVYFNGRIHVIGGRTSDAPGGPGATTTVEIYDIATNTWSLGAPMPEPRSDASIVELNGRVYVFGGIDETGMVRDSGFVYDISLNSWDFRAPLPTPRASYAGGKCGPTIHAIGGVDRFYSLQTTNYAYDPSTDRWTLSTPIPTMTGEAQAVSLPGRIYVASGGIFGSGSSNQANQVFECTQNNLFVSPSNQPLQSPGATIVYEVRVADMDIFNGWDILVKVDSAVLEPVSLSIAGNVLSTDFGATVTELVNCVNGAGTGCTANDGPGIFHSAASTSSPLSITSPVNGLLFTVTYRVRGGTFTAIDINNDIGTNDSCCLVPHTTVDGTYGTPPPDFDISAFPLSIIVVQGSNATSTVTLESLNGFAGIIDLVAGVSPSGPTATLDPTTVTLMSDGTAFSSLRVSATPTTLSGRYELVVTGTEGGMSRSITLSVTVIGDFVINADPASLRVLQGSSGFSTVSLTSTGFTGTLTLSVTVEPLFFDGPLAFLSQSTVTLNNLETVNVFLGVFTRPETPFGTYIVTVNARGGTLSHSATVTVEVLPPTITLTPPEGPLGTKVLVQGTGFPMSFGGPVPIEVTFDDVFLGIAITQTGSFEFTFNVPHAEPGSHTIKALTFISTPQGPRLVIATATFQVLPEQTAAGRPVLSVAVETGAVYFPGDTADIYVLTTLDGAPAGLAASQVEVIVTRPDGTTATLVPTIVRSGLFKASFAVPRTGSIGTYAVVATAQHDGQNASDLHSFEVKPSWISTQGPRVASATAIVGAIAAVGIAWRKGYFRRKSDEAQPSFP